MGRSGDACGSRRRSRAATTTICSNCLPRSTIATPARHRPANVHGPGDWLLDYPLSWQLLPVVLQRGAWNHTGRRRCGSRLRGVHGSVRQTITRFSMASFSGWTVPACESARSSGPPESFRADRSYPSHLSSIPWSMQMPASTKVNFKTAFYRWSSTTMAQDHDGVAPVSSRQRRVVAFDFC